MNRFEVFRYILKFSYWFCKLLGLCPFHYNSRKELFEWSTYEIFYSIFIWASFMYFYPTSGLNIVVHLNPLVVISFFYLAMGTITIVFMIQCWHANKLSILLNETQILLKELLPFCHSISMWQSTQYGIMFVCKTIITSGAAQIASINCCVMLCKMLTGKVDYFAIFLVSLAYFLQTLVPNMFYTFILAASMQYHQMNAEIKNVADQSIVLMNQRQYASNNDQFRKLSRRLDYIASLHGKLTKHTKKINQIFGWQLLIVIGNFVAILLIEVRNAICIFKCAGWENLNSRKRNG